MKLFIFKEMIHEDHELAHAGGKGDQRLFTSGAQALIKLLEDPVMSDGAEGSHIEGATYRSATAADMPPPRALTTILIIGCHAGQSSDGLWVEFSQFGHFSQNGGGHDWSDSGDGLQTRGFARQLGIPGNQSGDELITLIDLFFQSFLKLAS